MKVKENMHTTQLLIMVAYLALQLVGAVVAADDQAAPSPAPAPALPPKHLPGCPSACGDVEIPYPFGIGLSSTPGDSQKPCYLHRKFKLTCNDSKLYRDTDGLPILEIDILKGEMVVSFFVARYCDINTIGNTSPRLGTSLSISSKENKFVTIGCDSYGYLNSFVDNHRYSTGCITRCDGNDISGLYNGTCSGIGCCQVDNIPPRMWNISVKAKTFSSSSKESPKVETCTYSFVVKKDNYTFSSRDLKQGFPRRKTLPVVLDWTVGNQRCTASQNISDYACRNNSYCDDTDTYYGYRCTCNPGYEGNPYHPDGCTDINECERGSHRCISKDNCNNIDGNHTCFCPIGQLGDGTKEGTRCYRHNVPLNIVIGAGIGVIVLFVGTTSLFLMHQKRKLIKMREKFFQQNGGPLLKELLSKRKDSPAQIFTEDQLKKATDNYHESLFLGRGGFGTVHKGFLPNNTIIAVKKLKIIDASQIKQFINEVDVLLHINHPNVVKLLGCCLEAEVPMLVYEFVSNGTLFEFIHTKEVNNETWKIRLKIAAKVAGALSYLQYSSASIPIIHRDVKSANILLDVNNTAKVSDFGASRVVPLDQIEFATVVQWTIGYLDPEYMLMQTNQLTEKSDVYSFGVVLVELLTGEKPIPSARKEVKEKSLAMHFLSCLEEKRVFEVIQHGILDDENEQQIEEVANLAGKCLTHKGEERPTMKEVVVELDRIWLKEKHYSWINSDINIEEHNETLSSKIYEPGDSSKHGSAEYDSLKDGVQPIVLDDGR